MFSCPGGGARRNHGGVLRHRWIKSTKSKEAGNRGMNLLVTPTFVNEVLFGKRRAGVKWRLAEHYSIQGLYCWLLLSPPILQWWSSFWILAVELISVKFIGINEFWSVVAVLKRSPEKGLSSFTLAPANLIHVSWASNPCLWWVRLLLEVYYWCEKCDGRKCLETINY